MRMVSMTTDIASMNDSTIDEQMQAYYLRIRGSGHQFTRQKERIIQAIMESPNHITAKEIYDIVKVENISPATIYRTLHILSKLDIVQEVIIKDTTYYELKLFGQKPLHLHLKCQCCQRLVDLDHVRINTQLLNLFQQMERVFQVTIEDSNLLLIGLCPQCKEEKKCQDQ